MTALTLYGTQSASSLATACKLVTATGGVSASKTTKVGIIQGSGELFSLGSTATFPGTTVPTTAGVHGYLWDVSTLELQTIASGTWTVKFNLNWNLTYTTMSSTVTARVWKRSSAGVYTQIGSDMTVAGPGASVTTQTLYTLTGSSFASMDFDLGDKLYLDVWLTVTSTGGASTRTIALWSSSSATAGIAGQVEIDTPGYAPTPGLNNLILYGSSIADTILTTAGAMTTATGGTETSKVSSYSTGSGNFGEVVAFGGSVAAISAIPATPTGKGWVYSTGAGTFATGNWAATLTLANTGANGAWTLRFFRYSSGTYTSIGTISGPNTVTAKTAVTFPPTSMSSIVMASGDLLYIDLWYQDVTNAASDNATVYESTSATAGVTSDMQITTSSFSTSGSTVALSGECDGIGTISGAFSLATALINESDGMGVLTGSLLAAQALSPATITGTGTIAGSIQLAAVLIDSLAGTGTLASAWTLSTSLTSTIGSIGTLSGSLTASRPLPSVSIPGVGQLSGAFTLSTSLGTIIVSTGTTSGALTIVTHLSETSNGIGTLTGVLGTTAPVALTGTLTGIGTLTGTTQFSTALASPIAGAGTLASSWALATSLAGSATGVGILSGTLTASLALPGRTLAGVGTLSGTLGVGGQAALSVSLPGVGTLTGSLAVTFTLAGVTLPGIGTLAGVGVYSVTLACTSASTGTLAGALSARLSLVQTTLAGVGTLSGTMTLAGQAALSVSIPGRGQFSGTLAAQTNLGGTSLIGIGTLAGTIQRQIMLTCTSAASGQLSPGLGAHTALPSTVIAGTGTAAFTLFAQTSFVVHMTSAGVFTITGVSYQAQMALLLSGIASLSGRLSIPILSYLSATWVTRDGLASWKTRDNKANWQIHDEEAIWKTRS